MSKTMKTRLVSILALLFALMMVLLAAIDAVSADVDRGAAAWLWEMPRVSVWPETQAEAQESLVQTFTSPVLVPDVDFVLMSVLATPQAP